MVQSIDNGANRPNYNAVKINIRKPEVNAGNNINTYIDDRGIYNAVNIDIDNPTVNTEPKRIYDYPEADGPVHFDMINPNQITLPQGFNVAYTTTNVILPKIENEVEIKPEEVEEVEIKDETENSEAADEIENAEKTETPNDVEIEETIEIPEANYTTVEDQKTDNIPNDVKIMEAEMDEVKNDTPIEIKRPEIIPGEEIVPETDISLIISNLSSNDFDVQAQQIEEIARLSLDDKENAIPYMVREVFAGLINITKADSSNLAAPTEEQIQARKKLIANFIEIETARNNNTTPKPAYAVNEADIELANQLSPMEMAERNKEYALYTISILTKIYADEIERHTGNIVPFTDLPGSSAIVDALRYNPNAEVKIAAIDSLKHLQRPEYNEELTALYTLAQADSNPQVARAAAMALNN